MTAYLVTYDWHTKFTVGVFSSLKKAKKARKNHLKWMQRTFPDVQKKNYTISEITIDKICDVWYNDYINRKKRQ